MYFVLVLFSFNFTKALWGHTATHKNDREFLSFSANFQLIILVKLVFPSIFSPPFRNL